MQNKYVKNPLSLVPGGHTVELVFANGRIERHDRVKNPKKYVEAVLKDEGSKLLRATVVETGAVLYEA